MVVFDSRFQGLTFQGLAFQGPEQIAGIAHPELRRFGFRSWVVLRGTTPHDLAKDDDDQKVMGFAGASPMAIQCSI